MKAFRELDLFSLFIHLKFRGHNSYKTSCGSAMSIFIVAVTLVYGIISYTEQRGTIMNYTVLNDMNKRYYANLNRFELLWAFVNQDRLRDIVEIDLTIARLSVKKITLEPLVDVHEKDLDVFGCDDKYTCVDDEELYWRGTVTSPK